MAQNDIQKITLYIEAGITMQVGDYDGRTPLHIAASNRQKKMTQLLIEGGASSTAKDNFGNVPDINFCVMEPEIVVEQSPNTSRETMSSKTHLSSSSE